MKKGAKGTNYICNCIEMRVIRKGERCLFCGVDFLGRKLEYYKKRKNKKR